MEEILNLQPRGARAKSYQVRQVRDVIVKYKLAGGSGEYEAYTALRDHPMRFRRLPELIAAVALSCVACESRIREDEATTAAPSRADSALAPSQTAGAVADGVERGPARRDSAGVATVTQPTAALDGAPVRRDSAGVAIVTHPAAALDGARVLTLDTVAVFRIGTANGPLHYMPHQVRAAVRRRDGSVLVADDAGTVVRMYDARGHHIWSHGRRGQGPGEYRSILSLELLPGDSVVALDSGNNRISVIDPTGRYVRSLRIPVIAFALRFHQLSRFLSGDPVGAVLAAMDSLRIVVMAGDSGMMPASTAAGGEPHQVPQTVQFHVLHGVGSAFTTREVLRFPGPTWFKRGVTGSSVRFGALPHLAAWPHGFVVAHGSALELRRFDTEGELRQIVRIDADPVPVTDGERAEIAAAMARARRAAQQAGRPQMGGPFHSLMVADHHPQIDHLRLDRAGNAWIIPGRHVARERGSLIISPDGAILGWIDIPEGMALLDVGEEHLLVRDARSQDGVERLVLYRTELPRPS